jgi:hypothetical protein
MLDHLPLEMIMMIVNYLDIKDAFRLLSCNKTLWSYRSEIIYYHSMYYEKIKHLPFGNRFKGLECDFKHMVPPEYYNKVKYLTHYDGVVLSEFVNLTHLIINIDQCAKIKIPPSVYHLTLQGDGDIKDLIPHHITHLVFGSEFNSSVKEHIPPSVVYLVFGYEFNQSISKSIPGSVIYLEFGYNFNKYAGNCIPKSVRVLKFGDKFNRSMIYTLPPHLIELSLGIHFDQDIQQYIPPSLKKLTLGYNFSHPVPESPCCKVIIDVKSIYKVKYSRKLMSKFSFLDKGIIEIC